MTRLSLKKLTDILEAASAASDKTDRAAWAFFKSLDWPLAPYDEETFLQSRSENLPEANMTTNAGQAMAVFEEQWPGSRIDMSLLGGVGKITVGLATPGSKIESTFRGGVTPQDIGRAITLAGAKAHDAARAVGRCSISTT